VEEEKEKEEVVAIEEEEKDDEKEVDIELPHGNSTKSPVNNRIPPKKVCKAIMTGM